MLLNTKDFQNLQLSINDFKTWIVITAKDLANYFNDKNVNKSL